MRLKTLFKEILTREVPMDEAEKTDLKKDLDKEYDDIQWSPEYLKGLKDEGKAVPIKTKIKLFCENVYVRVIIAISYLAIIRWVRELKNPTPDNKDTDDADAY